MANTPILAAVAFARIAAPDDLVSGLPSILICWPTVSEACSPTFGTQVLILITSDGAAKDEPAVARPAAATEPSSTRRKFVFILEVRSFLRYNYTRPNPTVFFQS